MRKISDYYYNVLNPSRKYADFSHLFNHYKIHRLKTFLNLGLFIKWNMTAVFLK